MAADWVLGGRGEKGRACRQSQGTERGGGTAPVGLAGWGGAAQLVHSSAKLPRSAPAAYPSHGKVHGLSAPNGCAPHGPPVAPHEATRTIPRLACCNSTLYPHRRIIGLGLRATVRSSRPDAAMNRLIPPSHLA
jgi:hypothetical protein